jgi:hypothetical protein
MSKGVSSTSSQTPVVPRIVPTLPSTPLNTDQGTETTIYVKRRTIVKRTVERVYEDGHIVKEEETTETIVYE